MVKNRSTGGESEDVIEAVSASSLETMIESVENLAVLFCKYTLIFEASYSRPTGLPFLPNSHKTVEKPTKDKTYHFI